MNCSLSRRSRCVLVFRILLVVSGLSLFVMTGELGRAAPQDAPAETAKAAPQKQEPAKRETAETKEAEGTASDSAKREAARISRATLESELAGLRNRDMAPRNDKNIFSPLF